MITLPEPKSELTGLSDVLLGSLGLAGVLIILAVVLAALFAGLLFWWRSRAAAAEQQPDEFPHIV